MIRLLRSSEAQRVRRGLFNIDLNLPGRAVDDPDDPNGLAQLGRFDHAHLYPGVFVGMHPHQNDEILTYLREGEMTHEDTAGEQVVISNHKIMMMNAGSGIHHQESIPEDGQPVRLLQIFLRPERDDELPAVQFHDFAEPYAMDRWRLVAGHAKQNPPLLIRSHASVYDRRLVSGEASLLNEKGKTYLLHVFSGSVVVGDDEVKEGDSLIYQDEILTVRTDATADLVLFELDKHAAYSRHGMFSGV